MQDKRSLYKALPFEIEDENGEFLDKDSLYECYSYNSNFARCALNDENEEFFKAKKKQMMNLLYDEKCTSFYIQENPSMSEDEINSMSSTIYINQEEKELYIFAKQFDNLDCQKIFEEIKERLELTENADELKSYKPKLFFHSILLSGDSETSIPLYFGKTNNKEELDPLSPTYVLNDLGEGKAHLKVFLDNQSLILYHYSLSESSLGIKLECKSEQSKEIEKKDKERKEKEKKQKEALITSPSLSAFTPIIEDDTLMCPHGGSVKLQSQKGKKFKSKGVPLILESDLANSSISGCSNSILSGGPCTKIALIPPLALSLKKFNGEGAPLQEYASMIMTDKGVPLMCIPKPNQFKVFQPANPQGSGKSAKEIISNIKLEKPRLRLYYKLYNKQKDCIPLRTIVLNGKKIDQESPIDEVQFDLEQCSSEIKNKEIQAYLQTRYLKHYDFRELDIEIDTNLFQIVFIIPTKIPKVFKQSFEEFKHKDFGIGKYYPLYSLTQDEHFFENSPYTYKNTQVFFAPQKASKIFLKFDSNLKEEDYFWEGKIYLYNGGNK